MAQPQFRSSTETLTIIATSKGSLRSAIRRGCYLAVTAVVLTGTASAQKTKCTKAPVVFTIDSSYSDPSTLTPYTAAILSDGMGAYVNGQDNVSATLDTCDGSGDAVLTFGAHALRSASLDLRQAVDATLQTPSWANSVVPLWGINIWKVLWNYNATATYSFTTGIGLISVNNLGYYYRMENPLRSPSSWSDPGANTPCMTALVNVTHYPATSMSKETWIAWPDSTPTTCNGATPIMMGTLFYSSTSLINVGQFTTPFYIMIQRP